MIEILEALSPVLSAVIGVVSYATLTNYRLDQLDKQVMELGALQKEVQNLDKRVTILEDRIHG